jgi:hypothetical protein
MSATTLFRCHELVESGVWTGGGSGGMEFFRAGCEGNLIGFPLFCPRQDW